MIWVGADACDFAGGRCGESATVEITVELLGVTRRLCTQHHAAFVAGACARPDTRVEVTTLAAAA